MVCIVHNDTVNDCCSDNAQVPLFSKFCCMKNAVIPVLFWLLLLFQNHVNDQQQQQHETTAQKRVKKSTFDALFFKAKLTNGLSPPH